ncbi:MFS transporter [Methylobacterium soli]|uniref:MFS transporter n=1 Tax=Methylobacterium soli TaxID=553447 RepID=A0A6L3T5E7_9HYPH|nr:MFS transporter [Methylobacterium soli]KAB1080563.1 MFS transporter [Methylobacterium soli]GJE46958.1 putative sulfoacetate transporter SauU [Methylobacterium soli]
MRFGAIPYRWVIAVTLFVAYSIQYLDRVKTNVLNPVIAHDVGLSTADLGTGAFLMLLFYGPSQYVSGILTDRFGAKRILIFSVIAWSIMTAWMAHIQTRDEYFFRMALFGALVGTEYVPSARILMRWFNKEGRARAQALLSWAWILTPAWASVFATQFAHAAGDWRIVFYVTAAFGVVPLLLILVIVFDRPEQFKGATPEDLEYAYRDEIERGEIRAGHYQDVEAKARASGGIRFIDLFKSQSYIAVVVVDIVMQITLYGALTWIPLYLSDVFHFKLQEMGLWSGLYFAAGAVGSFTSSYLSDKVFHGNRRIMILACFVGLAPFVFLLANLNEANPTMLAVCLCGMGFFGNMAWGPFLTVPAEIFSPEVYGKAMGFVNGAGYTVAAFSAKIFASLVVVTAAGKDYSNGWLFIGACVLVGIVAASFIRTRENEVSQPAVNPAAVKAG